MFNVQNTEVENETFCVTGEAYVWDVAHYIAHIL